jgi:hypothetical protein
MLRSLPRRLPEDSVVSVALKLSVADGFPAFGASLGAVAKVVPAFHAQPAAIPLQIPAESLHQPDCPDQPGDGRCGCHDRDDPVHDVDGGGFLNEGEQHLHAKRECIHRCTWIRKILAVDHQ